MDIINLVLTICLITAPDQCREERLRFENRGSLQSCMFLAPTQIAKWSEEHPTLHVVKWRCAYPSKEIDI